MENPFANVMAAKSDFDLFHVINNKNIYEPEAIIAAIDELEKRNLASYEMKGERQNIIDSQVQKEQGVVESEETKKTGFLELFKPTKEYFYTPLIIYLNVLVYVLMVISGVHPVEPSVDALLQWGGNLRGATMDGEQWRLLTSIFLHGGLFHLLLNMFALIQIGGLLETHFGNHRYFFAYIVTGLFASVASLAYNENIVSVGASGAIFGLYGLLLALLILKVLDIPKESRNSLIGSILFFIGYNLLYGLKSAGIDNAAHIGGLVSGFVIGFIYYPSFKQPTYSRFISIGISVILLATILVLPKFVSNKVGEYLTAINKFSVLEEKALWMYREDIPSTIPPEKVQYYTDRLQKEGIDLWNENLNLLNALTDLPPALQERVDLLKKYCGLRIESCKTLQSLFRNENQTDYKRNQELGAEIEDLIKQLQKLNE